MPAAAGPQSVPPDRLVAHDRRLGRDGELTIAGVDEAGRGCWAGPVVAAAVILPAGWGPAGLDDSKKLTAARREVLCREIRASAVSWGACAVSAARVDQVNILQATLEGMDRALRRLAVRPDLVLVDGLQVPGGPWPAEAIVRGDATSACIAAASILAKVFRDRIMCGWGRHYPGYGFAEHKGYGAAVHREALHSLGPCAIHRFSYRPVAACEQRRLFEA